jgi:hypothetical protein
MIACSVDTTYCRNKMYIERKRDQPTIAYVCVLQRNGENKQGKCYIKSVHKGTPLKAPLKPQNKPQVHQNDKTQHQPQSSLSTTASSGGLSHPAFGCLRSGVCKHLLILPNTTASLHDGPAQHWPHKYGNSMGSTATCDPSCAAIARYHRLAT